MLVRFRLWATITPAHPPGNLVHYIFLDPWDVRNRNLETIIGATAVLGALCDVISAISDRNWKLVFSAWYVLFLHQISCKIVYKVFLNIWRHHRGKNVFLAILRLYGDVFVYLITPLINYDKLRIFFNLTWFMFYLFYYDVIIVQKYDFGSFNHGYNSCINHIMALCVAFINSLI